MATVIAALAGAGVTGLANLLINLYRDKRAENKLVESQRQEKVALLKLIHTEITHNLSVLKTMGDARSEADYQKERIAGDKLTGQAWELVKLRVAELLEDEQRFEHLIACYNSLHALKGNLSLETKIDSRDNLNSHNSRVQVATSNHWLAFNVCLEETGRFRYFADNGMLVSKVMSPDAINEGIKRDELPDT